MLVAPDDETAESSVDDVDAAIESVALESLVESGAELSDPFPAGSPTAAVPASCAAAVSNACWNVDLASIGACGTGPASAMLVTFGSVLLGAALMSLMVCSRC
ncbi:hypothetical protein DF048_27450 [Burkholderia seminalis]|nr:hypothetical protein DF048_27450 [Burkholderia seminalis]